MLSFVLKGRQACRAALLLAAVAVAFLPAMADQTPPTSKKIPAALLPFVEDHSLAGAVTLVANKDKVLSLDAVGFLDVDNKTPMPTDALFWIASQSKPITGAALMILVDEGKVKLDDPVEKFLPEFKDMSYVAERNDKKEPTVIKKVTQPITVRQIMSHTSGLPFKSAQEQPTLDALPLKDAVRSYPLKPLDTEPGTKYAYSNAGINTGGRIIEVVSGMPYEEFLDKRLFQPLGMKDTTFWPTEAQLKRLAQAYGPNADKTGLKHTTIGQLKYPLSDRGSRYPMPGGGLFSTASDMGRFCQMVLNGGTFNGQRILSEAAVTQMTSKQTGDALKENYGVGWSTGGTFGHGGALSTNHTIDPKRGLITVFLVQHAGFPGKGGMSGGAFKKAAEEEFGPPAK